MKKTEGKTIFVVDDQSSVCKAVAKTLKPLRCNVTWFTDPAECLKEIKLHDCDLVISDVRMPGMDGMELLRRIKQIIPTVPVLLVTGYGDVPLAVRAVKAGAVDFIQKPLEADSFRQTVKSILRQEAASGHSAFKKLTETERKVLELILQGKSNKEAAWIMHRSVRTIEDHRAHIMRKLNVENAVDLARKASEMGLYAAKT